MAAIDFPNSPSVNDQFTAAGKTWIWTGTSWDAVENNGGGTWGSITGTLSAQTDLYTALSGKEPTITAGTSLQYWRGDKSWQTLDTTAVVEASNLYFTESRVRATPLTGYVLGSNLAIAATDTVLQAFQKIQGQLSTQTTIVDLGNLSGSVVVDLSLGSKFRFAQTGNITSFSFSNEVVGREYMFEITRETTNYTFTFATGKYRFPIGAAPIMTNPTTNGSSPAKAIDILSCLCMISGRLDLVITPDMQNN